MHFFKRRSILRKANFLDLHPVRVLEHEIREDGNINLLMPRFRKKITSTLFQPPSKEKLIPIKLDKFGSAAWNEINSDNNVSAICRKLENIFPSDLKNQEETDDRVTKFLSMLYQQRYITFLEIQD